VRLHAGVLWHFFDSQLLIARFIVSLSSFDSHIIELFNDICKAIRDLSDETRLSMMFRGMVLRRFALSTNLSEHCICRDCVVAYVLIC